MTLKVRRILSLIFILLFFAITPAIILYAAGYRLGKKVFTVERTGMFIIDSQPPGAKISLNGRLQETWLSLLLKQKKYLTTPAKIKNLLPGEYLIKVELNGYLNWEKRLTISPGASTFAENIILFKNNLPEQIVPIEARAISFSPDKKQAVIISPDRLTIFNLTEETQKFIAQKGLTGEKISWSPDSKKIIVDNYLFNLTDLNNKTDLKKLTPASFNYKWADQVLYCQDKNSIYELSRENQVKKILTGLAGSDFLIKAENLFVIIKAKPANLLAIYNLITGEKLKEISLASTGNDSFINPEHALLNIYNQSRKTVYLIDPSAQYYSPLIDTLSNVKTAAWLDQATLLYANDFEIWLYNLATRQKTLITRIGAVINQAEMLTNKNYIIYSTKEAINAIELDDREKRNIFELAKVDSANNFAVDAAGQALYFSGKIGNQQGLYKLLIQQ